MHVIILFCIFWCAWEEPLFMLSR